MQLRDRRVTVMGLGRHGGGVAAARYAAEAGAIVTVTDLAAEEQLAGSIAELADVPIRHYRLGEHRAEDFERAEVLILNPAVPPGNPLVELARQSGAVLTTELELFLLACPAKIVAVTGSNGKSTTTTMLAEMFKAAGRVTWLGGNIGWSLLPELPHMTDQHWVALEVSSFQLAQLPGGDHVPDQLRCLAGAIVTNCQANHLDWHPDYSDYAAAKQRILQLVRPGGVAILNSLATELANWPVPRDVQQVPILSNDSLPALNVPGEHNRHNARCAAAAAQAVGCSLPSIQSALSKFRGLPHRLQLIGEAGGRAFYDDSMATTPESVVVALQALAAPVWLLAGGKDKGGSLAEFSEKIIQHAQGACFYGAARERMRQELASALARELKFPRRLERMEVVETLDAAFAWSMKHSAPGDAILLSPGCASYDQFRDYVHRAEFFSQLMQEWSTSLSG